MFSYVRRGPRRRRGTETASAPLVVWGLRLIRRNSIPLAGWGLPGYSGVLTRNLGTTSSINGGRFCMVRDLRGSWLLVVGCKQPVKQAHRSTWECSGALGVTGNNKARRVYRMAGISGRIPPRPLPLGVPCHFVVRVHGCPWHG
ncbi:hypothetical protein 1 [Xingshan nematode virus 6]|uniref:Uncharacterized protein n=1 Tax=Xingshan nematode virus 6 TaxID=1923765 RepID=A0A1L3KFL3_9VIRU|nr:hypothetical protein 1 [Xingshan nematode virus 6]APG76072.1 hypothetical protein 1 [Xingshan nematode virus 6]